MERECFIISLDLFYFIVPLSLIISVIVSYDLCLLFTKAFLRSFETIKKIIVSLLYKDDSGDVVSACNAQVG